MRKHAAVVAALVVLVVAGCFPLTVDVGPDGRILVPREEGVFAIDIAKLKATIIYSAKEGGKRPAWARWSPDGKKVMFVLAPGTGGAGVPGMGNMMGAMSGNPEFWLAGADGTGAKKIYTPPSMAAYALWSPDGKSISVGLMPAMVMGGVPPKPKIAIIDATGKNKATIEGVFPMHCWTKDSKQIVGFKVEKKIQKKKADGSSQGGDLYVGAFGLFDAGGTGFKPLAQAICQSIYLTASSDGKYIAFVALAAGDKGAKLEPEEGIKLVLCDIKTGKRDIVTAESGGWAAFSPDGETLAYNTTSGLFVKDIASGSPRQVTSNITTAIISQMGSSALIYPVWLSNTKLLFWRETATLGTAGKALTAFTATVTGSKPRNVQVRIDAAVATAISKSKKK